MIQLDFCYLLYEWFCMLLGGEQHLAGHFLCPQREKVGLYFIRKKSTIWREKKIIFANFAYSKNTQTLTGQFCILLNNKKTIINGTKIWTLCKKMSCAVVEFVLYCKKCKCRHSVNSALGSLNFFCLNANWWIFLTRKI